MNEAENFFLKFRSLREDGCNARLNLVNQDGALWVSLMVELRGEKPARGASSPTPAAPPPASARAPPSRTQTKRRRRNGGRPARLRRRLKREAARAVNFFSPEASTAPPATAAVVEASPAPPATAAVVEALSAPAAVVEALPSQPTSTIFVVEAAPAPPAPAEVVEASPTPNRVQLSPGCQGGRGFSFVFPPLRKKITGPDSDLEHSNLEESSGSPPLLANEEEEQDHEEEEDDKWEDASSDVEFSRFCNCSPPGNCLDCRNASSLYEFGDTTQPTLVPIQPRRSRRLQQLGGNHW